MKKYIILLWLALIANVVQGQQLVRQVQTLADLANVADGFQSLYNVQYGYTEGDGLGGVFFYDSNGAASTNIFNVIDSNIIAGQWVRSDTSQKELRLSDANNSDYTGFQAPSTLAADVIYTMPSADGAAGYVLSTDGSKTLTWSSAASLSSDTLASIASTKVTSPAIHFDGSNDYIEIAYDDKLSFTDGTDDLPFSISAWVKTSQIGSTELPVVAKWDTSAREEYRFGFSSAGDLELWLRDESSSQSTYTQSTSDQTAYNGEWVHIAATYGGTSGGVFSTAADNITLFVNGASVAATASNNVSYFGVEKTVAPLVIGERSNSIYFNGHIRDVKIFNRELTSTEVAELAQGNDFGFADEWAGAFGGVVDSDFSNPDVGGDEDLDGFTTLVNGSADGNIDSIGGLNDWYRFTTSNAASAVHRFQNSNILTIGKRYRLTYTFRIPSANSNVDGYAIKDGSTFFYDDYAPSLDTNITRSVEFVASNDDIQFFMYDGGAQSFTDAGGDDVFYIRNIKITEIGTLADFRAERFDSDTGKLYDLSTNAYVGVNNDATLTGLTIPVYETGTWTPSITFGGGSTGITYTTQEGHYTRYGNWVSVHAYILLSAKGSDTGTALIAGLPFTARNTAASSHSLSVGNMANAANLTSAVTAYATDNGTTINLVDWGATGIAVLDDTNFGATTSISVTGIYQIQ